MRPTPLRTNGAPRGATSPSGLELRQLRVFVALVERRRIIAAAGVLGLAQSTVSEALSALERSVGTPLILRQRGGHGLELTEAGRTLLPHARTILSAVDDAHAAMSAAASHGQANVAIVANESISSYLLPGLLARVRPRWPKTRFTVSVATCAGVRDGVASGAFDLGFLLEEQRAHGRASDDAKALSPFTARRVVAADIPLVFFTGAAHALLAGGPEALVRRAALAAYPLFVSDAAGDFHDLVLRFFAKDGIDGPAIEATGSIEGVKKAVTTDIRAIGLLPAYAVAEEVRAATIVPINLRPAPPSMRVAALLSRARPCHPSAEELMMSLGSNQAPS